MRIIDKENILSYSTIRLLHKVMRQKFNLGRFTSLNDVLTKLGVDVVVDSRVIECEMPAFHDEALRFWKPFIGDCSDAMHYECTIHTYLRGTYDAAESNIRLFPIEMQTEYEGKMIDELLVMSLIHETMHAYFHRSGREGAPYVMYVEEPLAEFGMLYFLHETQHHYFKWAYPDVLAKNTSHYLGAKIYDKWVKGDSTLLEYFREYNAELELEPTPLHVVVDEISLPPMTVVPFPEPGALLFVWRRITSTLMKQNNSLQLIPKEYYLKHKAYFDDVCLTRQRLTIILKRHDMTIGQGGASVIQNYSLRFREDLRAAFYAQYSAPYHSGTPISFAVYQTAEPYVWEMRERDSINVNLVK